ncbi:MAG: lytic transglycosylase domain-containing protein [Thermoleophilia bacterium]
MKSARRIILALFLACLLAGAFMLVHLAMPGWYARWLYPLDHAEIITKNASRYQLDPALVAAVIYEESSFNDQSVSKEGAIGLMQLLPSTATWISTKDGNADFNPKNLEDPAVNISYGCWYLRYLLDRYENEELALAAYNGGTENVDSWVKTARSSGRDFNSVQDIPWRETRDYVSHVDRTSEIYTSAYAAELGIGG